MLKDILEEFKNSGIDVRIDFLSRYWFSDPFLITFRRKDSDKIRTAWVDNPEKYLRNKIKKGLENLGV